MASRTSRGRPGVVVAVVVAAAVVLTALVGARLGADTPDPPGTMPVADRAAEGAVGHAVVERGGTLWELAEQHTPPGGDPRPYLHRLRELNDLGDAPVPAWTVVLLPPAGRPG